MAAVDQGGAVADARSWPCAGSPGGPRNVICDLGGERGSIAPKRGCEPIDVAGPEQSLSFPVDTGEPAREIAKIAARDLYHRRDGGRADYQRILARARKYPQLFAVERSGVRLR